MNVTHSRIRRIVAAGAMMVAAVAITAGGCNDPSSGNNAPTGPSTSAPGSGPGGENDTTPGDTSDDQTGGQNGTGSSDNNG